MGCDVLLKWLWPSSIYSKIRLCSFVGREWARHQRVCPLSYINALELENNHYDGAK